MPSLADEIEQAKAAQVIRDKERKEYDRNRSMGRVREAVVYTLGQEPDGVTWDKKFGGVAIVENVELAVTYQSSTPTLAIVCVCDQCGGRFLSAEKFGSDKNHYSNLSERGVEERRKAAVQQIAKIMARGCQPNGYGHDHQCLAYVTRQIPVSLVATVDALLTKGEQG